MIWNDAPAIVQAKRRFSWLIYFSIDANTFLLTVVIARMQLVCVKTSQELQMLSPWLQSLTLNVMIRVSQFVRNSELCHLFAKSLNRSRCLWVLDFLRLLVLCYVMYLFRSILHSLWHKMAIKHQKDFASDKISSRCFCSSRISIWGSTGRRWQRQKEPGAVAL